MANFYQSPDKTNDPNWLGQSKEPDRVPVNKSLGELFEGVGNLIGAGARAVDGIIKNDIMDSAHKLIDPLQDAHGSSMTPDAVREIAGTGSKGRVRALQMKTGLDAQTPTMDEGTALGYGPEDAARDAKINSIFPINDRPLPPQASKEISNLQRLQEAYYAGNLSDSYYNAQLVAVAKQLRAQYPGYRDEVDAAVSRITGVQPANALRASLVRDIQFNLSAQMANANADQKFRDKYRPIIASGGYDPDTASMETIRPYVNQQLGEKYTFEAAALRANVGSPEAEANLSTRLAQMSTGSLAAFGTRTQGSKTLAEFEEQARQISLRGGGDPKEIAELVRIMALRKNELAVQMRQVAYLPIENDPNGRSLVGKVKDGDTKLDSMITAQLKPWDHAIELIKSGSFSALQQSTDALKYRNNILVTNLRNAFPGADQMTAITEAFPNNPLIQNQFLTASKLLPDFHKAIENGLGNAILSGKPMQPAPKPSEAVDAHGKNLTPEQTNAVYKQTANKYDIVISPENRNTDNAAHVAKQFFSDMKYYDNLSDDGRMKLFIQMAAPSKTKFLKELSQRDPEVFRQYQNWALYAAGDIWRRGSDNLQAQLTDPRYDIRFNLERMEFVDHTHYRDTSNTANDWNINRKAGIEQRGIQKSVNALNNAITYLRPIVGDKPADILPALGLNPQALKEDLIGKKIFDAVAGAAMKGAANAKKVVTEGTKDATEGMSNMQKWNEIFGDRIENPQ